MLNKDVTHLGRATSRPPSSPTSTASTAWRRSPSRASRPRPAAAARARDAVSGRYARRQLGKDGNEIAVPLVELHDAATVVALATALTTAVTSAVEIDEATFGDTV